jgi:hypothetical protein
MKTTTGHHAIHFSFHIPAPPTIIIYLNNLQSPSQASDKEMAVMPMLRLRMPKREPLARIFAFCCSSWEWPDQ